MNFLFYKFCSINKFFRLETIIFNKLLYSIKIKKFLIDKFVEIK